MKMKMISEQADHHHLWWSIVLVLSFLKAPATGLSNLRVHVPATIQKGDNAYFDCTFSLEEEQLYAIKWYRGNYEIFRFIPSEKQPIKTFPLDGYTINLQNSTGRSLVLMNVDFINSGAYSCEVIVDLTFHTLIETKKMLVIKTPALKPTISAVKDEYKLGDKINPICTSWNSHPSANLSWFINGEPARSSYLRRFDLRKEHDGTFTTVLGLQFELSQNHFRNGRLTLQCTASILSVYWRSTEVHIKEGGLQPSQVLVHIEQGKTMARPPSLPSNTSITLAEGHSKSGFGSSKGGAGGGKMNNMPVEQLTSHMLSSAHRSSPPWRIMIMLLPFFIIPIRHPHLRLVVPNIS